MSSIYRPNMIDVYIYIYTYLQGHSYVHIHIYTFIYGERDTEREIRHIVCIPILAIICAAACGHGTQNRTFSFFAVWGLHEFKGPVLMLWSICIYIHIQSYLVHIYIYIYREIFLYMCIYTYIYTYVNIQACLHILFRYVYICVCVDLISALQYT